MDGSEREVELESLTEDRYERQKRIPWWNQEILKETRALILGAGTLGGEIIKDLALLGVGHLTIVDFDLVEKVNLSRTVLFRDHDVGKPKAEVAAERAMELNPDIEAVGLNMDINTELGLGYYLEHDIVFSSLDNREARLRGNQYSYLVGIPFIDGGIYGLEGRVQVVIPPETACYECTFSSADYKIVNLRFSCPGFPLDLVLTGKAPMVITTAAVIGAIMVEQGLLLLHGRDVPFKGKEARYNGYKGVLEAFDVPKRKGCTGHEYLGRENIPVIEASPDSTVSEVLNVAREKLGVEGRALGSDREIVYSLRCESCGHVKELEPPKPVERITQEDVKCPVCGSQMVKDETSTLLKLDIPLSEYGLPSRPGLELMMPGGDSKIFVLKEV